MDTNIDHSGQSTSTTSFQLFVAGHCDSKYANMASLTEAFSQFCSGKIKVDIPNNKWKGFCFVYVFCKADLERLIQMEQINVHGQMLAIKPHKKGQKLDKMKQDLDERRIFVRIVSRKPIQINVEQYFSRFGPVESAYKLDTTEKCQKGLYNVISYVLFKEKQNAQLLLRLKKLNDGECEFLIKKVQDKLAKQKEAEKSHTVRVPTQKLSIPVPPFEGDRFDYGETCQRNWNQAPSWKYASLAQYSTPDLSPGYQYSPPNSSCQLVPQVLGAYEPQVADAPEIYLGQGNEDFCLHSIVPTSQDYFQSRDYLFSKINHKSSKIRCFWKSKISPADQMNVQKYVSSQTETSNYRLNPKKNQRTPLFYEVHQAHHQQGRQMKDDDFEYENFKAKSTPECADRVSNQPKYRLRTASQF